MATQGNWPSPSSSSSTLSALAPPFTVERPRPNLNDSNTSGIVRHFVTDRIPHLPSDPTPRMLSSGVVQSETFYPQYGPVGDTEFDDNDYQWNAPYDEGNISSWEEIKGKGVAEGIGAPSWEEEGIASKSFSWMEPCPNLFTANYVGATGQDVSVSEAVLPSENNWRVNHFDAFMRKSHLHSDRSQWLDDKPSIKIQGRPKVTIKRSTTSALSSLAGGYSFPSSSSPPNSVELCGNFPYESLIASTGSGQSNQVSYQKTKCSFSQGPIAVKGDTGISVIANTKENPYMHDQHVGEMNVNYKRSYTLSKPTGVSISRKVEIKPSMASGGKKSSMHKAEALAAPPTKDNKVTESFEKSSNSMPSVRTNLIVQTRSETNDSSQISSEPFDQLNLSEDSPCWKGASFSKNSPFHVDNAKLIDSSMEDKKLESEHQKLATVILAGSERKSIFLDASRRKNDVSLVKDAESSSPSIVCEITVPLKDGNAASVFNVSCGSVNANSNSLRNHPHDNPSSSDAISKIHIMDSSLPNVYHFDKVIKEPQTYCSKEGSKDIADPHLLVRSLYDLSSFLLGGYSHDASIFKKEDHGLLSATMNNLNICVKAVEQCVDQANNSCLRSRKPSNSTEVQMPKTEVNSISVLQSNQRCKLSTKAQSLMPSTNNDGGGIDLKSAITKEIEKSMKKIFSVEEQNPETNLYKMRWIETEAALCSANCELILARTNFSAEIPAQQSYIACQLPSFSKKESRRETIIVAENSLSDLDENNELVSDAFTVSSRSTSDLAKDSIQTLGSEKLEAVDSSSAKDVFASVMTRYAMLKDRIHNVEPHILKDREKSELGSFILDTKQTIPGDSQENEPSTWTQSQASVFASTSASKSHLLNSCEYEDTDPNLRSVSNMLFNGFNYSTRNCVHGHHYGDDSKSHTNVLVGHKAPGEFPADCGNSFFQSYALKDHYMDGHYVTNRGSTSGWEHVGKADFR